MGSTQRPGWIRLACGLVLTLAVPLAMPMGSGSASPEVDYADFADISGLTLLGSAAQVRDRIRLTDYLDQAGGLFTADPVQLSDGFQTEFAFQITQPMGCWEPDGPGADGIAFLVVPQNSSLGSAGGGLGYAGLGNSLAVEFDTWNNGQTDDGSGNHVGINLNGSVDSVSLSHIATPLNNGNIWHAWVEYQAASHLLEVWLSESATKPASPILAYSVDVPATLGADSAYVGFTGGTGCGGNLQEILAWRLETAPSCPRGDVLTFAPPLNSGTATINAGEAISIRFASGHQNCLLDDSVTVRVRDAATDQLIAGYAYGAYITFNPATGMYQQGFATADYGIGPGRTLKVMVYFENRLRGIAFIQVV